MRSISVKLCSCTIQIITTNCTVCQRHLRSGINGEHHFPLATTTVHKILYLKVGIVLQCDKISQPLQIGSDGHLGVVDGQCLIIVHISIINRLQCQRTVLDGQICNATDGFYRSRVVIQVKCNIFIRTEILFRIRFINIAKECDGLIACHMIQSISEGRISYFTNSCDNSRLEPLFLDCSESRGIQCGTTIKCTIFIIFERFRCCNRDFATCTCLITFISLNPVIVFHPAKGDVITSNDFTLHHCHNSTTDSDISRSIKTYRGTYNCHISIANGDILCRDTLLII